MKHFTRLAIGSAAIMFVAAVGYFLTKIILLLGAQPLMIFVIADLLVAAYFIGSLVMTVCSIG